MAVQKILFVTLLTTLIGFRVSAMAIHINLHHAQTHELELEDDNKEGHCELCEHALEFIKVEFSSASQEQCSEVIDTANFELNKEDYYSVYLTAIANNALFGRPPPLMEA